MFENIKQQHSRVLDDILQSRRTVRAFSPKAPDRAEIEAVIRAGLIAPFGALAVAGRDDFRKVIVIPNTSPVSAKVADVMKDRIGHFADGFEKKLEAALRRVCA